MYCWFSCMYRKCLVKVMSHSTAARMWNVFQTHAMSLCQESAWWVMLCYPNVPVLWLVLELHVMARTNLQVVQSHFLTCAWCVQCCVLSWYPVASPIQNRAVLLFFFSTLACNIFFYKLLVNIIHIGFMYSDNIFNFLKAKRSCSI